MHEIQPFKGPADKERIMACIRGEATDRVPNFEILIEDEHVTKLLGREAGNTLGVGGDPAKGSEAAEGARPMYPADGKVDDAVEMPLVQGTPEDVTRDVKAHMDVMKPGGRWMAGCSHSIVNYIPHENFIAMINAIHEFGEY